MPAAQINVLAGHPRPALRQVLANVSAALSTVLDTPEDRLSVWVNEVDPELWMVNGRPAGEALGEWPRADVEVPFVVVTLLEGRSTAVLQHLVREVTDGVVHALDARRERVRVVLNLISADVWGIGGVPASVVRAEEISAGRLRTSR